MSIGDMVSVSHFLFVAAGLCGIAAAVLFFALDISKCWRMVSGKAPVYIRGRKSGKIKKGQTNESETAGECGITVPLGDRTENICMHDKTAVICREMGEGRERTTLLETGALGMELIQDIVYVQEEES